MKKALIIDDEADICFLLSRILKSNNIDGDYATTISDGIAKFNDIKPELLFLDISLPDGSGINEIKNFKKLSKTLKIVIISAYDSDRDRASAKKAGADLFIPKPFSRTNLNEAILKLFPN